MEDTVTDGSARFDCMVPVSESASQITGGVDHLGGNRVLTSEGALTVGEQWLCIRFPDLVRMTRCPDGFA